jgi:hypothetical protein
MKRGPTLVAIGVAVLALLLFGIMQPTAAGDPDNLEGIRSYKILVEDMGKAAGDERITRQTLESQVLTTLRTKAPMLRYDPGVVPRIYVNLTLLATGSGYVGTVFLEFARPVEILVGVHRTGEPAARRRWTVATVWDSAYTISGSTGDAAEHVRRSLDELLTDFVADYLKANQ